MANAFDVLGVSRTATDAEIKAAFKQKAKDCHPDLHPDDPKATARFAELSGAYDELKDGKAATYQQEPKANPFARARHPGGAFGDINIDDLFRHAHDQMRRQRGKNDDISIVHTITLEEAFKGKTMKVNLELMRGHTVIEVSIPPGISNGTNVRVPGGGHDSDQTLPRGDLYVTVMVIAHREFHVSGIDLILAKEIDMFTAILGGSIKVTTISGSTVEVTVPGHATGKRIENGSQLRVPGHGMPAIGAKGRVGDLIIAIEVSMPKKLSAEQLSLIAEARALAA